MCQDFHLKRKFASAIMGVLKQMVWRNGEVRPAAGRFISANRLRDAAHEPWIECFELNISSTDVWHLICWKPIVNLAEGLSRKPQRDCAIWRISIERTFDRAQFLILSEFSQTGITFHCMNLRKWRFCFFIVGDRDAMFC